MEEAESLFQTIWMHQGQALFWRTNTKDNKTWRTCVAPQCVFKKIYSRLSGVVLRCVAQDVTVHLSNGKGCVTTGFVYVWRFIIANLF